MSTCEELRLDIETLLGLVDDQMNLFEDRVEDATLLRVGEHGLLGGWSSSLELPTPAGSFILRTCVYGHGELKIAHIVYPLELLCAGVARARRFKVTIVNDNVCPDDIKMVEAAGNPEAIDYWRRTMSDPELQDGELPKVRLLPEQRGAGVDLGAVRESLLRTLEAQFEG